MSDLNESAKKMKAVSRLPTMRARLREWERELQMHEHNCNWAKAAEVRCEMAALEAEIHMMEEDF